MSGINPQPSSPRPNRYEVLADEISRAIETNVLRPGTRLPSVRQTRKARRLSPSTVFRAYDLLESRGLIRAVPRSGYFVVPRSGTQAPEPTMPMPREGAHDVDIADMVYEILTSVKVRQIVPFGSAFPSPLLFPLDALRRAPRRLDAWDMVEDLPPGNERLRRLIGKRYLQQGLDVAADEIVLTTGALEALNLCLGAVARPGDAVVIESPCFYGALQALERLGLKAIEVATHPCDGVHLASLARILETQRPKACWLMTNFQNPLGCSLSRDNKRELVDLLSRHDVPLIEDDVYGELYHGSEPPVPAKAFDRHGLVMHCSSFSKTLAPGYRVGWVAAGRFASDVRRLKLMISLSGSIPAQDAVADYLQQGGYDRHLRRLRAALAAQKEALVGAVTQHFPPGTRITRPAGGYFIWVDLPWEAADTLALRRSALAARISIAPGPMFSNHGEFRNCLRLNFGHPWTALMEQAVATLGELTSKPPMPTPELPARSKTP
jgi:DNA-binding transcriptional MocR family regulator